MKKLQKPKGQNGLQFGYGIGGTRIVLLSDILCLLHERGQKDLAKEIVLRAENAFELIDNREGLRIINKEL